jgi:hypothetical protein
VNLKPISTTLMVTNRIKLALEQYRWSTDQRHRLDDGGFNSWQKQEVFHISKTSRPALGPTQLTIHTAKFKNEWSCTSSPSICLQAVHRNSFIFTLKSKVIPIDSIKAYMGSKGTAPFILSLGYTQE